ncbi:MAG: MBOAT family protein, partial [Verrucomicrobia bacterium]|nr:MBOAT family protein [Verrucomicrobiota bacterium]
MLLLAGSIAVNAAFGKLLCSQQWQIRRSGLLLFFGVSFNFGLLAYFKYAGFLLSNIDDLFGTGFGVPSIVLPIGISFFTFQQIAFLVDARRGLVKEFSWLDYALFVTFFPQLIAGPIVHHAEMMPQFRISRSEQIWHEDVGAGFSIFCFGLFKKVVIADSCAVYADAGYATISSGQALDPASAWITVIAYSLQLYYDFSGYSDMAVGLARIFGIRLPLNFNSPYKATGFIDFWRRWHITLSRFLRDYLYVPLGGSRTGAIRQYVNLAIVMLLGGLWHGANWTFVIWGGLHGFLLGINHAWRAFPCSRHWLFANAASRALSILLTFVLVSLAWIPFRAESLGQASLVLDSLFDFSSGAEGYRESLHYFAKQQFLDMGYAFDIVSWFRPKELWPATPPPNFLSGYRPAGMFLLSVMLV